MATMANTDFRKLLASEDIKRFTVKSDWHAGIMLFNNWLIIALAFALPALWLNPLTILISLVLLGNRQLGLAIIMHECAHNSFFKTRSLNPLLGHWLCGAPMLVQIDGYRSYHLRHHRDAGTTDDPDYPNYKAYPVSKASFRRKIIRDLTGITGIKTLYALMLMNAGILDYDLSYRTTDQDKKPSARKIASNLANNLLASVIVHFAMWLLLYLSGHGWLYLLWPLANISSYALISRIRNAAEHAAVPDLLSADPRLHARTTIPRWWERLLIAPNFVNYHLEHHWVASVPNYRLRDFHQFLVSKGFVEESQVAHGYWEVLQQLTSTPSIQQPNA